MTRYNILVVEDEQAQRRIIASILRQAGYQVREAADGETAVAQCEADKPDLVLCDWKLPGMDGGEVLRAVREQGVPCAFVVMTAYGSIAHAVEAIQMGADDYLSKPFERDALLISLQRVLRTRNLQLENRQLRQQMVAYGLGKLVGRSPAMQTVYRTMGKVAQSDVTVLICGESGTGKELVARTLHEQSGCAGPFVAVNCAAIPETLMESELFGHESGAFTGARKRRLGKFEEAGHGSLFLDEIAAMPLPLQATLLRVLQERRFTRLGGMGEVKSHARIIAASNRDLAKMVEQGGFRQDLYYRLNVVPLRIPPLRDRREDIPLLVDMFLKQFASQHKRAIGNLPGAVMRCLMEYAWPGNVRELGNVIERLVLLADGGAVTLQDLPEELRHPRALQTSPFRLPPQGIDWDAMEEDLLAQALDMAGGNRSQAARLLGMSYKTFLYRLGKHDR